MKKLVSLLLTLALALTLVVPTLAVDVNSPDYKAGFAAGYDEGYLDGWSDGYDEGSGYEPSEFERGYDDGWEAGYDEGLIAGAADAKSHIYTEQSMGQPPEDYDTATYEDGYTEGHADGFSCGYDDGFADVAGIYAWDAQELLEKGGAIGQVNVLFNDRCIQFTDALPKIVHGRTMIPIRAVSEGMDKVVDWDNKTKTVTISDKTMDISVVFAIGSKTATVYHGEEASEITMDCAPYIENDRTMVPVRFLSEALGYTVLWDSNFNTVVVVDADAVAAEIDSRFTKFNEIAAKQNALVKLGDQVKLDYALKGDLTMYDETGKATSCALGMDMALFTDSKSFRMDITLNLKSLAEALTAEPDFLMEDADVSLKDILSIDWSKVAVTLLMDETGHCWMNAPALNILLDADKDAWMDLGTLNDVMGEAGMNAGFSPVLNLDALMELPQNATLGQILVAMCSVDENAFHFTDTLNTYTSLMEVFYGDSVAKDSGSSCTWTTDASKLLEAFGFDEDYFADLGIRFAFSLQTTMDAKGNTSMKGSLSVDSEELSTITGSLDIKGTADSASMTLKGGMEDFMRFTLTMTCDAEKLDTLPAFAPPAGATILNVDDLVFEDISPADGE